MYINSLMILINTILAVFQIGIFLNAIRSLKKCILDFAAIVELLYCIWFVPVVFDMMAGTNIFSYVYKITREFNLSTSLQQITFFNFISFLIIVSFEAGYRLFRPANKELSFKYEVQGSVFYSNFYIVQAAIFVLWVYLEFTAFRNYDGSLRLFLSASRKTGIYSSFYIKNLIMYLPLVLLTNYMLSRLYQKQKLGAGVIKYLIIVVAAILPTGQRREMISILIFVAIILVLFNQTSKIQHETQKKHYEEDEDVDKDESERGTIRRLIKKLKFQIILILGMCAAAIPFFWILRWRDNQIQNIGYVSGEARGILELIFGSGATGFPTLIAIDNYCSATGTNFYLRNVLYLLQVAIPRSILGDMKIGALTEFVQQSLGTSSNLSIFYVGDLYFTFGIFGVVVSFLTGYFLSKVYNKWLYKNNFRAMVYALVVFSQIVTFFKNGLAEFLIKVVFLSLILLVDFKLLNPGGKIYTKTRFWTVS